VLDPMAKPGKSTFLRSLPKLAVGAASIAAAVYVGLSPRIFPALYVKRLFRPLKFPEGDWTTNHLEGVPAQDVYFAAPDGSKLHGMFFERIKSQYVILFSHGNSGNITGRLNLARLIVRSGASLMLYDYRGYGRSEGTPTLKGIIEDGIAAYDYLIRERGYKPSQIILYGESLGAGTASEIAAARPCAGIILQSGFTSLPEISEQHMPVTKLYPRFMYPTPLLDNVQRMAMEKRPVLIIHGHKDQVVPFRHAQQIFERASEPKMFVELPDCSHSDIWNVSPDLYTNSIRTFMESLSAAKQ
jgi:fermentation-respiration switch protein FrsA (DUF1100 family)